MQKHVVIADYTAWVRPPLISQQHTSGDGALSIRRIQRQCVFSVFQSGLLTPRLSALSQEVIKNTQGRNTAFAYYNHTGGSIRVMLTL